MTKDFILYFLILVLIGEAAYLLIPKKDAEKVLAVSTTQPTLTPSPSPTTMVSEVDSTPTPTPKPTKKPTPMPVSQPKFTSEQINGFIDRFSGQYGVDPNVMRHIALCESSFNPFARLGPYWGLYQFGSITWQNLRKKIGEDPNPDLRLNAEEAAQTAAYALSLGESSIWPHCHP